MDAILEAARQRPPEKRGGHSPLYEHLWDHYEELAPGLNPPRRPYWDGVAAALRALHPGETAAQIADGDGKPPTGERVRKAWWQVRRDKARLAGDGAPARARPVAKETPAPEAPAAAAAAPVAKTRRKTAPPPAAAAAEEEDETDVLQFAGGRKV
ncbi:hypothetical protein [Rhodovastum atsumiense]|uniref:Uncharacterized protein n=1 Tax=Rhodovastum atsumiense TaxID=504468 RepID=A0A5M6IVT9_9PROT|nr:hypothetical protein [Rhodovastum atsumiense]KAA5611618.1 hypothetical protein F1189_13735 [Rhodovastum atsumiense]